MGPALPIVAIAATAIGAGITAVSSIQQGRAAKQQSAYQAQVAELNQQQALKNQQLAATNAGYVEDAAAKKADDEARAIRATMGAQRASLAANGLLVDERQRRGSRQRHPDAGQRQDRADPHRRGASGVRLPHPGRELRAGRPGRRHASHGLHRRAARLRMTAGIGWARQGR